MLLNLSRLAGFVSTDDGIGAGGGVGRVGFLLVSTLIEEGGGGGPDGGFGTK